MRTILSILCLIFGLSYYQTGVYDIQFSSLDGTKVNMADFHNKKIVVVTFGFADSSFQQLIFLDSLQKASGGAFQTIGIPSNDFGKQLDAESLKKMRSEKNLNLILTTISSVKKASSDNQHPLLQWLTDVRKNTHFDYDVSSDGQLFVLSESGELFAVLDKQVSMSDLQTVLTEKISH